MRILTALGILISDLADDDQPIDKYDGLKKIRPKLAQPWWYRLVGFTYAKPDKPSRAAQAAIRRNERKRAKMRLYVSKPRAA